eukprot:667336-Hanusia_phi.AAC.4
MHSYNQQVISAILAITYYAAKPAASDGEIEKSEYSSLDQVYLLLLWCSAYSATQLPPELGGSHK